MSRYGHDSNVSEDRGRRPSPPFPAALAVAAFVLTALPLAIASALASCDPAAAFDLRGAALLIGTVSL